MRQHIQSKHVPIIWGLLFAVLASLFAIYFVGQEKFIYFWDYSNYWQKTQEIAKGLIQNPLWQVLKVFISIRKDDYNELAAWPLLPFYFIFGASRLVYILSLVNIWMVPAALSFLWVSLAKKPWSLFFLVFFSPFFWDPALNGYVDVGGVIFIHLALVLFWKFPWNQIRTRKELFTLAVILSAAPLFRRWYSYWTESFFILSFLMAVWHAWKTSDKTQKYIYLKNWGWTFLYTGIFFTLVSFPLPLKILKTNYAYAYASSKTSQNFSEFLSINFFNYFGLFHVITFFAGILVCFLSGKETREKALFIFAQFLLIIYFFARVQDFGAHHYYMLLPAMILAQHVLYQRLPAILKGLFAAGYLFCFLIVLMPSMEAVHQAAPLLTPERKHYPRMRTDLVEIKRLRDVLLAQGADPGSPVYMIASSKKFNSDTIKVAERSMGLEEKLSPAILWTYNIDRSEGLPKKFFSAKYVVLIEPTQYHVKPKYQQVIGLLADAFIHDEQIAASYEKLPEVFHFDEGATGTIFKKTKDVPEEAADRLKARFLQSYPDWEKMEFTPKG